MQITGKLSVKGWGFLVFKTGKISSLDMKIFITQLLKNTTKAMELTGLNPDLFVGISWD